MRIGGCSFAFGPKTLEDAAEILSNLGFNIMDLGVCSNVNAQVNPHQAAEAPDAWAENVRRRLETWELELNECFVLDFGRPINDPNSETRLEMERLFKGLIKFVRMVGCRSVMLIPGVVHSELGMQRSFEHSVVVLKDLSQIAHDAGILLNIEACEPSVVQTPESAEILCESVPHLGLTLDYSHFVDQGYSQQEIERLHFFARHFHIRQATPGKRVEKVEKGTIDFEKVIQSLKETGYDGVLTVEYVDCEQTTQCGVDVLVETRKMKRYLEQRLNAP